MKAPLTSEAAGANPETFFPLAARGYALEIAVEAGVSEVEGIGNSGHWLEADKVFAGWRVDDRNPVLLAISNREPLLRAFDPKLVAVAHAAKYVIELMSRERDGIWKLHRFFRAGRDQFVGQFVMIRCCQVHSPLIARRIRELIIRMEADRQRHGSFGVILDRKLHLENAATQPVLHLERMRERELRHQVGMLPEFQAAHDRRFPLVCRQRGNLPIPRVRQQSVNWRSVGISPEIAQRRVQNVLLAVSVEGILIQAVGPRRQERNARERWLGLELL